VFNPGTFNPCNAADPGNRMFNPAAFSDARGGRIGQLGMRVEW
jgi:hypothetical protein